MSTPVFPRDPVGEWAYRILWIGVIVLPGVITLLRWLLIEEGLVWMLWLIVGIASTAALQIILAAVAWLYRQRQWRHWLGRVSSILSFIYYWLWLLLAITLPDGDPGRAHPSPMTHLIGHLPAQELATALMWLTAVFYVATLVAIVVEGERAVASDPSGRSVRSIVGGLFRSR